MKRVSAIALAIIITLAVLPAGISATTVETLYHPLGDGGESHVYNGIPFLIGGFGMHVEKRPDLDPDIYTDSRALPQVYASRVHVVQYAGHAQFLTNNTVIGQIHANYTDGTSVTENLVIGVNTAEWAYERSDNDPPHDMPEPAYSFPVYDDPWHEGEYYMGHMFYACLETDQDKILESLELVLDSDLIDFALS